MNFSKNTDLGVVAIVLGSLGYCLYSAMRMNDARKSLFEHVDMMSDHIDVDISDALIEKAVNEAAKREADKKVAEASKKAIEEIRNDMSKRVSSAVNANYYNLKDDVEKELKRKVSNLDVSSIRRDAVSAAKNEALSRFKDDMDEIRSDAKDQYEEAIDDIVDDVKDRLNDILDGFEDDDDLLRFFIKRLGRSRN